MAKPRPSTDDSGHCLIKRLLAGLVLLIPALTLAGPAGVHVLTTDAPPDEIYAQIHAALEGAKFWVVFEADMGSRMETFGPDWGSDYNKRKLTFVKSMVFCNLWWTNQLANADPELLGLCPLHLSIYAGARGTTIVWPNLDAMAAGSPGQETAKSLDGKLSEVVRGVLTRK